MNQTEFFVVATGGTSAPLWLPALNQWVALFVGILSIIYLIFRIYTTWKGNRDEQ